MTLRLGYVAGVSPGRWLRTWAERRPDQPLEATRVDEAEQFAALLAGEHDLAFVRLPVPHDGLHAIPLWEEVAVAVLAKEHPLAAADTLELADLANEPAAPEQPDAAMTVELVAAGTGFAILPHGVARLHHRRDVVAIPVTDAPPTRIALVWRVERDDADIQEFVGVVRGRTAQSSRGAEPDPAGAGSDATRTRTPRENESGRGGSSGAGAGGKHARGAAGTRSSRRSTGKRTGGSGKHSGKGRRR
ncbi:LysR family substrate-binding domain-containing protein [Agromyces aerolatus]|uniref:LysR family substrate-binding domain-containing protein n=1 Tax=Agromyces sp. LY-1074 TaxID=3074080 RepID=UPI0028586ACC|nr:MULTISPECIES: LysR family substrate-binding domain-containing protein [unclassified Agromyces]MDR5698451.1 LysR family substrate-binding domain-containing protein [Agromyces sp. LY-1074]MDR5704745.1 LysR family substrate-binding domain-containing protein [Agromyces sp. LY-1358]